MLVISTVVIRFAIATIPDGQEMGTVQHWAESGWYEQLLQLWTPHILDDLGMKRIDMVVLANQIIPCSS